MKVYVAGAISGQKLEDVKAKFNGTKRRLEELGFKVLSPLEGVKPRVGIQEREHDSTYEPTLKNHAIVERDKWYVQQSDVMLVDLRGCTMASIGSCFEIAWGQMMGKYIIAVIPEEDIIHRHAFLLEGCDVVFSDFDEAIAHLCDINYDNYGSWRII